MQASTRAPAILVAGAFAMTLSSAFGQTFFIGLFAPDLKRELGLTDGSFGAIYTLATIASACLLFWSGKVADRMRIRWLAFASLAGLAAACTAMASLTQAWMLVPVLLALRFFGQGAQGHLALTGIGRWYRRRRGTMTSIAILGFPTAEAFLPALVVASIAVVGWRQTWLIGAGVLCFLSLPLVMLFLRREPPHDRVFEAETEGALAAREWTRAEVLRSPLFFALLAGIVTPSFVSTGIFFHIGYLADLRSWSLGWYATWLPLYAVASVATALLSGWLVDRFGARQLLPWILLPLSAAMFIVALFHSAYAVPLFLVLIAMTQGSSQTLLGALWVELFGARHYGAIRSVAVSAQVFATALAPGLIGVLLDAGVAMEAQHLAMAVYALAASLVLKLLQPRLKWLALHPAQA